MEKALIKTITFPPSVKSVATILQKVNVQLYTFTFILPRIICFMLGGICFMSFYLLIYISSSTLTSL